MGFFEFAFVFSVAVLMPLLIVKMTTDHSRRKLELKHAEKTANQQGVTVGELKKMIGEVVDERTAALSERIEALERDRLEDIQHEEPDQQTQRTVGRQRLS